MKTINRERSEFEGISFYNKEFLLDDGTIIGCELENAYHFNNRKCWWYIVEEVNSLKIYNGNYRKQLTRKNIKEIINKQHRA